ncbi:uncharacterized protein METZ01_LOCUS157826, partial [marine metagenome]
VLFLMLPLLLFNTSMVFKPGIEVNVDLPVSSQRSGVGDPSLAVAVDANGIVYFRGGPVLPDVFSLKVSEEEESLPLSELLVNRYPDLDSNSVLRAVEQGRVLVNDRLARLDDQLKSGQQVELELPSTELLHPKIIQAIEQGGLQPGEVSLLIQADKAVRHEVIIDLCTMAGEIGVGHVLLASRPPDFSQPFEPQPRTEP